MNTKTTKFLAVLAVFVMAFAGFAVFQSEDSDAQAAVVTTESYTIDSAATATSLSVLTGSSGDTQAIAASGIYLVNITSGTLVFTDGLSTDASYTVYIKPGLTVELPVYTANITVYTITDLDTTKKTFNTDESIVFKNGTAATTGIASTTITASSTSDMTVNGYGLTVSSIDGSASFTDTDAVAKGLAVKTSLKVDGTATIFRASSLGGAVGALNASAYKYTTAALAKASPATITVLASFTDDYGGKNGSGTTNNFQAINIDLGGFTVTVKDGFTLVGDGTVDKYLKFIGNSIVSINNGTITYSGTVTDIATADMGMVLISTYGPLTLGNGTDDLKLDISGATPATASGASSANIAAALQFQAGASVIKSGVTIDAGDNVAFYVNGATGGYSKEKTTDSGTDNTGSTIGSMLTVNSGATVTGEYGTTYYTQGSALTIETITELTKLVINGGTFSGSIVAAKAIYNGGSTDPTLSATGAVLSSVTINGGTIAVGDGETAAIAGGKFTLNGTIAFSKGATYTQRAASIITSITDSAVVTISGNSTGGWDAAVTGAGVFTSTTLGVGSNLSATSKIVDTLSIASASTMKVGTLTIGVTGTVSVEGKLLPVTSGTSTVTNNGSIVLGTSGQLGKSDALFATSSVAGAISGASYTGDSKNVFINGLVPETELTASTTIANGKVYDLAAATEITSLTVGNNISFTIAGKALDIGTLTIGSGSSVTISSEFTGKIITNNGTASTTIEFDSVKGCFTVSTGSDKIHGTIESGTVKVVNTDTVLDGLLVVESGASIEIQKGAKLHLASYTLENAGTIYGEGTLCVNNDEGDEGILVNTGNVYVTIDGTIEDIETAEELEQALPGNTTISIKAGTELVLDRNIVIPEGRTIILNAGSSITVAADYSLTVVKSIIKNLAGSEAQIGITVKEDGAMYIDTSDVLTNVFIEDGGAVVMTKAKSMIISGQSINTDTYVGYGNTLVMDGISIESGNNVYVYGALVVDNKVTIGSNATLTIYKEGSALISGTLQNAGTVNVIGKVAVDGTVNVTGTVGKSAYFNVTSVADYGVYVSSGATFNVSNASNTTYSNNLSVAHNGTFFVAGELVMKGTLAGFVEDLNTVTVQGIISSSGANITVYEDAVLNVASAITGVLTVNDLGIFDEDLQALTGSSYGSDMNQITLQNVQNVTITESVVTKVNSAGTKKYFYGEMTISGNIASPSDNGKIGISATLTSVTVSSKGVRTLDDDPVGPTSTSARFGYVYIGDLTLKEGVVLTYSQGTVIVSGNVSVTEDGSDILNSSAAGTYNNLTVNGSIAMGGKDNKTHKALDSTTNLNAVYYIMSDADKNETGYYTSADAAIAIIDTVDDKKITTYGYVAFTGTADLENRETIIVSSGSYFEIDGTMAIGKDTSVTNSGTIDVYGTLTIEDYVSSVSGYEPLADVLFENDPSKTYCSLAGAIALGATDITLNRDATVSKDLTIPAAVTVSSDKYSVTVSAGKVLDVAGGLVLTNGTVNLKISTAKSTPNAALVVEGYVVVKDDEPTGYVSLKENVDGAHYEKKVNGLKRSFISSIEYAALNTLDDNTPYVIYIVGKVAGTEASFIPGKNSSIIIYVEDRLAEDNVINQLAVLEIGLAPGASLYVDNAYSSDYVAGQFSGTVTAMTGDGTEESSIVAAGATGIYFDAMAIEKAAGTVYYLYLSGDISGIVTVAAGTATIDEEYSTFINAAAGDMFTVAEDAELVINSTVYLWLNADLYNHFVVDGLVTIDGASAKLYLNDSAVVNGEIDVVNAGTLTVNYDMYVLGDIVISDALGKEGKFYVKDVIYLGEKPTTLGSTGSIVGPGTVDSGVYIVQYPGADLSGAKLNWNVAEEKTNLVSTDYIIDGETYMTVWAMNATVLAFAPIYLEDFEIIGIQNDLLKKVSSTYDAVYWFTDITMEEELETMSDYISTYVPAVYAYTEPAGVKGTITVGVGLTLYVDGVGYTASTSRQYSLDVGMHNVYVEIQSGYVGDKVTIKFNDAPVSAGKITITPDMTDFNLVTTGAEPYTPEPTPEPTPVEEKEWTVTTILLCVLVVLIAIMAVIVALRLNRN